jgi:hypothetical protein
MVLKFDDIDVVILLKSAFLRLLLVDELPYNNNTLLHFGFNSHAYEANTM